MAATKSKTSTKRASTKPASAPPEPKKQALAVAPEVLHFSQAAQFLNTSVYVVKQEMKRGRLTAFRVGNRRIGFRRQALLDYIEQREREGVVA
jgi:hypothetical protein